MQKNDFTVDIHHHITLRVMNTAISKKEISYWQPKHNTIISTAAGNLIRQQTKDIAKVSQTNLYAAAKGNVKILFDSLYPMEDGFFRMESLSQRLVGKKNADTILRTITGMSENRLKEIRKNTDYFSKLQEHYECLLQAKGSSPDGKYRLEISKNYEHLQKIMQEQENTLVIVPTIEGAHAFGCGSISNLKQDFETLRKNVTKNIATVKQWKYPPFFVNLAHHFWNQLSGHAASFKPPSNTILTQEKGKNLGINSLGWRVIFELLTRENGRRMLIDIKHLSIKSRQEYYRFVIGYNRLNPSDNIPVICSHTGVSGFDTFRDASKQKDRIKKMRDSKFNNWTLNLCNDDIRVIYRTDGLIGIMLDKGLLASAFLLKKIKKLSIEEQQQAFLKIIWDNVFQIIKTIKHKSAWNIIALGSDYDGIITHIDFYPNFSSMPLLKQQLIEFLEKTNYKQKYWYGYTPNELVHKMMTDNAMQFMAKYYSKKYLEG